MTTRHEMAVATVTQYRIACGLEQAGEPSLAARLRRCATARRGRHCMGGWPWTCRSVACVWCRQPIIRRWWAGMVEWRSPHALILAVIPVSWSAGSLRVAVRRLRRALRDLRDQMARRSGRWRGVCLSGLVTSHGTAMVVFDRGTVDRAEFVKAVQRRWAGATVTDLTDQAPSSEMTLRDAIELAALRRGIEPLRLLVLPQRDPILPTMTIIDPMPVILYWLERRHLRASTCSSCA